MKRNTSIEVYRCVLMFGIVLLHCCSQGPLVLLTPYRLCMACVTGFIFISGYFGIKFSWSKVFSLIATAVICAGISFLGERILHLPPCGYGFWEYLITGNWFLWAYVVLMMFAPLMERALSVKDGEWRWAVPLLIVVFGWNFLSGMPVVGRFLPSPTGFGTHTFLMMIGVYLAARLFRLHDIEKWLIGWKLWVPLVVSGALCAAGLSHYDSPVSFVFMACLFVAFKRLDFGRLGVGASWIAPSMFSVYLLHWSPLGVKFLHCAENCMLSTFGERFSFMVALATAMMLFIGSVILDIPRRLVWRFCANAAKN